MSLKAKLEAVIYAAEEPVTLSQLANLFAAEALEWKLAQEAASAEIAAESVYDPAQTHFGEGLEYLELRTGERTPLEEPDSEVLPLVEPETRSLEAAESVSEPAAAPSEEEPEDADAEAKRVARQRDREVKAVVRRLLDELIAEYATDGSGIEIREIAGGFRMATKPECHDAVRMFIKSLKPAMKLSLPALETLAVIAYKQPVTAPEVNEIRGVDSSGVFGSLLARKLITTAGRKQVIGRPILYKTTREFLLRFGLKDVSELPSMDEFEKMAAIELEEPELAGENSCEPGSGYDPGTDVGSELDENASEDDDATTDADATTEFVEPAQ
jgi:segregation and condensation protein B